MEDAPVESVEVGGRGKKLCKGCGKYVGARSHSCSECGYEFSAVAASTEKMIADTGSNVKETVISVKSILSRVEEKNPPKYGGQGYHDYDYDYDYDDRYPQPAKSIVKPTVTEEFVDYAQSNDSRFFPKVAGRNITTPSEECPVRPKGYKSGGWPDGKATPEVVKEWAVAVYDSSPQYALESILYWARHFWDINDRPEFARIRNLIIEAISQKLNRFFNFA